MRAFVVPEANMANVFLWRQQDWARNSLQMLARSYFSHAELDRKGHAAIHDLLHGKGVNWATLDSQSKSRTYVMRDGATRSDLLPIYAQIEALLLGQLAARQEKSQG